MNGTIGGDLGLHSYPHQQQAFSQQQQQQPTLHYQQAINNSPVPQLNSLISSLAPPLVASPTATTGASLGQYVNSNNTTGYNIKLNSDIVHSDHSPLPVQSLPSHLSLPPPSSSPSPSSSSSASSVSTPLTGSHSINNTNPAAGESSKALLTQMNQLGPSERCTPSQAQSMGQQLLSIIAQHEKSKVPLPGELNNSFDVFHRCLAVVYGTFFLNLYSKANAPCLLCHGCKSLYPPGQFIHHSCPTLPPNILPCRSRMWRRCLVPLLSQGMDKLQQKQRWKYVLEKFSHTAAALAGRRNPIPPEIEAQLLEMPELKRGRFVELPSKQKKSPASGGNGEDDEGGPNKPGGGGVKHEDEDVGRLVIQGDEGNISGGGAAGNGKRYQELNMEGEQRKEDRNNCSPQGAQNLLDIEPGEYDLEDGSLSNEAQPVESQSSVLDNHGVTTTAVVLLPGTSTTAVGLAEQLVGEIRKLQQELTVSRAKLKTAAEIIEKMPSEACMREQVAQALASQQTLMVERDQAREQLKLAQERGNRLQKQVDELRVAYGNMEKLFAM